MPKISGPSGETAAGVLARTRELREIQVAASAETLVCAVDFADLHLAPGFTEHVHAGARLPRGEPVNPGRDYQYEGPWLAGLAWHAPAEFAAALGRPTASGLHLMQSALELRGRLPRVWARVLAGQVEGFRAVWIAEHTVAESDLVAEAVDRLLAPIAHKVGKITLDRVLTETIARLEPARALAESAAALDRREVQVLDQVSHHGVGQIRIRADLKDILDFDATVAEIAAALAADGCAEDLDVRRSMAVGVLADPEGAADLLQRHHTRGSAEQPDQSDRPGSATSPNSGPDPASGSRSRVLARRPRKHAILHLHLSEAAVTGNTDGEIPLLGRLEQGNTAVLADRIRDWCGRTDTHLVVLPVRDLADHHATDAYEHPDRLDEQAELIHKTCMFPYCTRPAQACDKDHAVPYDHGGRTCSCNTVPLCRRHHRLKTDTRWRYQTIETGTYLWTSPYGQTFLRDLAGTEDLTPAALANQPADGCRHHAPAAPRAPAERQAS